MLPYRSLQRNIKRLQHKAREQETYLIAVSNKTNK